MITSTVISIGLFSMAEWFKINAVAIILAVVAMFGSYSAQQVEVSKMGVRLTVVEEDHRENEIYKSEFIAVKGDVTRMQGDIHRFTSTMDGLNESLQQLNLTLAEFKGSVNNTKEKLDELQNTQRIMSADIQDIKINLK